MAWIEQLVSDISIRTVIDVFIVWLLIYYLLKLAQGSRLMDLLKGVSLVLGGKLLSSLLGLQTIDWLLGQVISWGVVAAIIIFQPELRKVLQALGRTTFRGRRNQQSPADHLITDLEQAMDYMAKRKIGALIVIEGDDSLEEYIETGTEMGSKISFQLLTNLFIPNSPLHDGAVIISDYRIASAASYLPLSESGSIPKELGTRHRAAIGLGEVSDALVLVVSEETGAMSVVKNYSIYRDVDRKELNDLLNRFLVPDEVEEESGVLEIIAGMFAPNPRKRGDD